MTVYEQIGNLELECGKTLKDVRIAFNSVGTLTGRGRQCCSRTPRVHVRSGGDGAGGRRLRRHLERWAEFHPTHLAIFRSFFKMVKDLDGQIKNKFWHEVVVLDGDLCEFEYVNCNSVSGSLRFLPERA